MSVTQFFSMLKKLWQELDLFNICECHHPEDAIFYHKIVARECIYDFLAGLNRDLDEVRDRL